ncbi:MAG TPA: ATP-binding protein [Candidatus Eremiobacteraceae bacterium]
MIKDRAVSVRIAQLLAGVVLAITASFLYPTYNAYLEYKVSNEVRAVGSEAAQREAERIDNTLIEINSLAIRIASGGYNRREFTQAAQDALARNPALRSIDYFNAAGEHVLLVAPSGPKDMLHSRAKSPDVSFQTISAVTIVQARADLTKSVAASEVLRMARHRGDENGPLNVFAAAPIMIKHEAQGEVVARIDIRSLLVDDLHSLLPPAKFTLDDSAGRQQASWPPGYDVKGPSAQTFPIKFADRQWELDVEPALPAQLAKPWWFIIGGLLVWLVLAWPIEVVGQINRRVRVLNEGLEARVAARTRQLQSTVAETRKLAAVVESVSEGVMLVSTDGTIRYANAALANALRCKTSDLTDKSVHDIGALALSPAILDEIRETVARVGYMYLENARTRSDGSTYWAGVSFTAQRDADGKMVGLIAVSRDITDRRALVDQLVTAKGDLERQMRVRADFIGTASHELRTPATTLRTLCALLVSKIAPRYSFDEEDRTLVGLLDRETKRLSELVDDLLEVGKIDAEEARRPDADVDVADAARSEVESFRELDEAQAPPVELRLPAGAAVVRGDDAALRRVVGNLVGNARKFTPASGLVTVTVERSASRVRLTVADTGVGIPEADLPHIFDRFYRVERPGTAIRGTGLGLAIVARLVEQMHGTIAVSSVVGKGTTVTVEFPAAAASAAGARLQAGDYEPSSQKLA